MSARFRAVTGIVLPLVIHARKRLPAPPAYFGWLAGMMGPLYPAIRHPPFAASRAVFLPCLVSPIDRVKHRPAFGAALGSRGSSLRVRAARRAERRRPPERRPAHLARPLRMLRVPRVALAPLRAVHLTRPAVHAERFPAVSARADRQLQPPPHIHARIVPAQVHLQPALQRPLPLPVDRRARPLTCGVVPHRVDDVRFPAHLAQRNLLPACEADQHPRPERERHVARHNRNIQRPRPKSLFELPHLALRPTPRLFLLSRLIGVPVLPPLDLPAPVRTRKAGPTPLRLVDRSVADLADSRAVALVGRSAFHAVIIERPFDGVNGSFDQFAANYPPRLQ